jgi:DNA polymerase bacteriophage-type
VCELAEASTKRLPYRVIVADVLNAMLRSLVKADNLLVADYGAVEARGTAWVACEQRMLDAFGDPRKSVYLDMGQQVFRRPISKKLEPQKYTVAKTLVLGCGYGMSAMKFDFQLKLRGIPLEGITAKEAVNTYRQTYPAIPQVWRDYHDAVHSAVAGHPTEAGRCMFQMVGSSMHCILPSGRPIVYRNARIEPRVPAYCVLYGMPLVPVDTVVFDKPRAGTGFLYGSKVCENVVQAICRDLLAHALVCCEQEGLRPILHVHDEIVCQAPPSMLNRFMEIMSTGPEWARDFPILAEGYSGPVWSKKVEGYEALDMLNGRKV